MNAGTGLPRIAEQGLASEDVVALVRSREAAKGGTGRESSRGAATPERNPTLEELRAGPPKRGDGQTNRWLTQVAGHLANLHHHNHDAYIEALRDAAALVDPNYEDFDKVAASVWRTEHRNHPERDASNHRLRVEEALERLIVGDEARQEFAKFRAERDPAEPFDAGTLDHYLASAQPTRYRVEGLMLLGGDTIVSAKRKTGKTTFNVNLAYSLITGEPFLGQFEVERIQGRVAVLNYEVTGGQFASWGHRRGVPGDRLILVNLRGRRNPLGHPQDRAALAEYLRKQQIEVLIVDPFGRAFTGSNQNDVSEVGGFLADLDLFARAEVGATDLVLSVHTGWNGERSRGSSGLEDWPDSIIRLTTREGDETGPRFLSAIGRDVELAEDELQRDSEALRLWLTGAGSRKSSAQSGRQSALAQPILGLIRQHPGIKSGEIQRHLREAAVTFRKGDDAKALQGLVADGLVVRRSFRNAQQHYLPGDVPQTLASPSDDSPEGVGF